MIRKDDMIECIIKDWDFVDDLYKKEIQNLIRTSLKKMKRDDLMWYIFRSDIASKEYNLLKKKEEEEQENENQNSS